MKRLQDELSNLNELLLYGNQVIIAKCCFNHNTKLVILTPQVAYYYNDSTNNMRVLKFTSIFVSACELLKIYGVSTEDREIINEVLAGANEIDEEKVTIIQNYEDPVDEVKLNNEESFDVTLNDEESFDEEEPSDEAKHSKEIIDKYNLT